MSHSPAIRSSCGRSSLRRTRCSTKWASTASRCIPTSNKIEIKRAVEEVFKVHVTHGQHHQGARQDAADGQDLRDDALLEESNRDARSWRADRSVPGRVGRKGISGATEAVPPNLARPPRHVRLDLRGDHQGQEAGALAPRAAQEVGRAQQQRPHHRPAIVAAATSACTGSSTGSANKIGMPARVIAIEYDPNRSARIALLQYEDGEKRYILAPVGLKDGARRQLRPGGRAVAGQRAGPEGHPDGYSHPQHRAEARARRPDGAQRRRVGPVDGQGRRLGAGPPAERRGAAGADRLHGHARPGRQPRARHDEPRQGGPEPLHWASARRCADRP